jgi:SAM-dependent methyltransferase
MPSNPPCPVCGEATAMQELCRWRNMPVLCHGLSDTPEAARQVPRGEIHLLHCDSCGHTFNGAFDPRKLEYDTHYENSLEHSARFREYLAELVRELTENRGLRKKRVLEIGCGQGSFLRGLCKQGANIGTGCDPCHTRQTFETFGNGGSMEILPGSYKPRNDVSPYDWIVTRHVLEHVASPRAFLSTVARSLAPHGRLYVEVPNALWILRDLSIWDLLYEHHSYFSPSSLTRVLLEAGFADISVRSSYGEQFLQGEATVAENAPASPIHSTPDLGDWAAAFPRNEKTLITRCREEADVARSAGEKWVIWSAGSKSVTFLNAIEGVVVAAVDINPRKQGCYIAGSGQRIIAPEDLPSIRPDRIVVMNPLYLQEIEAQCRKLGVSAQITAIGDAAAVQPQLSP